MRIDVWFELDELILDESAGEDVEVDWKDLDFENLNGIGNPSCICIGLDKSLPRAILTRRIGQEYFRYSTTNHVYCILPLLNIY